MSSGKNDRLKKIQFIAIVISVILVFVLAFAGFQQNKGEDITFLNMLYATVGMFLMSGTDPLVSNHLVLLAQSLAAILFGLGVFSLVFNQVQRAWNAGKIRFTYKEHVVIFSLSTIGQKLASEMLAYGYKVVVVEPDEENSYIHQVQEAGGIVITGSGTDGKSIGNAGIANAATCIITGDSDQDNMEVANEVLFFRKGKKAEESLKIMLHITDHNNINVLKDYLDIHNEDEDYDLETFNVSQLAAREIYDNYPPHRYLDPADDDNSIAIIGYNQAAEEFLLENIILSHYPELHNLQVYLFDKDAATKVSEFNYRYPFFSEFVDIHGVNLLNASFYANFSWSKKEIEKLSKAKVIYLFGESDSALLTSAANLRQFLYNQTLSITAVPIVVCLPEDAGMMDLLGANRDEKNSAGAVFAQKLNIHQYKLVSDTCTAENLLGDTATIDRLSKMINYYYSLKYEFAAELKEKWNVENANELVAAAEQLVLNLPDKEPKPNERLVQKRVLQFLSEKTGVHYNSLFARLSVDKRWNMLTHRKKDSNRYAARQLPLKFSSLKRIGCDPLTTANITRFYHRLAPMEHKRWSAEKMVFSYKYGPLSDDRSERYILKEILKIHNQLIPYDKLSEGEKEKDLNLFLLLPLLDKIGKFQSA